MTDIHDVLPKRAIDDAQKLKAFALACRLPVATVTVEMDNGCPLIKSFTLVDPDYAEICNIRQGQCLMADRSSLE